MVSVPDGVGPVVSVDAAGHLGPDGRVDVHVDELDAEGFGVGSVGGLELYCYGR